MPHTVSEAVARPARTAIQAAPAAVVVELVDAFFYDLSDRQYAALLGGLVLLFAWLQAVIENRTGKALLREVPPTQAPVVESDGQVAANRKILGKAFTGSEFERRRTDTD